MASSSLLSQYCSSSSSSRGGCKGNVWRYDAGDGQPLVIRAKPAVEGKRTEHVLQPGALFKIDEERISEDGILFLKLSDGRGWVFDRKPGVGKMCERYRKQEVAYWRYLGSSGRPLPLLKAPTRHAPPTGAILKPQETFAVSAVEVLSDGSCFLSLADGRGWAPEVGVSNEKLCESACVGEVTKQSSPYWKYVGLDEKPIFLRTQPDLKSERSKECLLPGELFKVSEERRGRDGILYLRLADDSPSSSSSSSSSTRGDSWDSEFDEGDDDGKEECGSGGASNSSSNSNNNNNSKGKGKGKALLRRRRRNRGGLWAFEAKPGVGRLCERHEAPVILHIYDVPRNPTAQRLNGMLRAVGTGAFHAAVEVYGLEWSFGGNEEGEDGTGVFTCPPKGCEGHTYRESLHMGHTPLTEDEARALIGRLSKLWVAKDYNILRKNCCNFSNTLCESLGVGSIPNWVRNLSGVGRALVDSPATVTGVKAVTGARDIVASVVARGKESRGASPEEAWRPGDFTLGLVSTLAQVVPALPGLSKEDDEEDDRREKWAVRSRVTQMLACS